MSDSDEEPPSRPYDEDDPTDETLDFRFAASLISAKSGSQLPKRGEKDFEPHGTKHQEHTLESSRQAMHDALKYMRSHTPKNHIRGFYYGYGRSVTMDQIFSHEARNGLEDDHVVLVEYARGSHFKTIGKMTTRQKNPSLWLLPEEALYLVERGFLDLWWPPSPLEIEENEETEESVDTVSIKKSGSRKKDEGTPMSLQAAYAMLIGNDYERGKVSLDRYIVYGNLRRTGYVVQRAPDWNLTQQCRAVPNCKASTTVKEFAKISLFNWLFGNIFCKNEYFHNSNRQYGPLVKPGMYRSYNTIYEKIAILPRHKPLLNPIDTTPQLNDPYRVVFFLWKGDNLAKFTKKNPGNPDFRLAIINAHFTPIPSLKQISHLIQSTPFDPPDLVKLAGPGKTYQRLKHGWRNVVLAVIDQGVISYMKLVEGAFGEELIYERFDKKDSSASKCGYRRTRGHGKT